MVVNKTRVRDWARLNKVDATPVVSADDFAPGWDPRVRIGEGEDEDEEIDEEDEEKVRDNGDDNAEYTNLRFSGPPTLPSRRLSS